jgi:uncharacterized protein YggE
MREFLFRVTLTSSPSVFFSKEFREDKSIMKKIILLLFLICTCQFVTQAQESGNSVYNNAKRKTSGVATGNLYSVDQKDVIPSSFLEANVLMNIKADEYLAVFGVMQESATIFDNNKKMDVQINDFITALQSLGIKNSDIFIDFITQNRIYDFSVAKSSAVEKFQGFELKKNIAVRYKDKSLLEKMLAAASKSSIFDLIKVDYIVSDMAGIRDKLLEEASKVVKKKEEIYTRMLGIKMRPAVVVTEKFNAFFPAEMYGSYVAFESGNVDPRYRDMSVVEKRKASTFYYTPLHSGEFDATINSVGVEPVVQLTLYLRVKYVLTS